MTNCRHFANLEDNLPEIWNRGNPHLYGYPEQLEKITEPIIYIQAVLAGFRRHVDSGKEAKAFIKEKRCGCEPPCREHKFRLISLSKAIRSRGDDGAYCLKVGYAWDVQRQSIDLF